MPVSMEDSMEQTQLTCFNITATLKVAKSICARGGVTDLPTEVTCSSSSSSSSSGTKTSTEASASTSTSTGSTTASASDASTTSASSTSSDSSSSASASAAATSTGAAVPARKDSSLVAAAGVAAAFAILI